MENQISAAPVQSLFKCGFVALLGRPNTGKSTLLNTVIGENLALVSALPQTTRTNMRGIYSDPSMQLIFIDTPGIHDGSHTLNKAISAGSLDVLTKEKPDCVCYCIDISRQFGEEEDFIVQRVLRFRGPVILLFNKKDICPAPQERIDQFVARYPQLKQMPQLCISAMNPDTKDEFLKIVTPFLPVHPPLFPIDEMTDSSLRFFAAEALRKQVIELTREEVPHATCIEILSYKEEEKRHVIEAVIHVETKGQRGIIVGSKGAIVNRIKMRAGKELQKITGLPVVFKCHIKVTPEWRDDKRFLHEMGLMR